MLIDRTLRAVGGTCAVALLGLTLSSGATAQTVETAPAISGGTYTLPEGDYRKAPGYAAPTRNIEIPAPRIPGGQTGAPAAGAPFGNLGEVAVPVPSRSAPAAPAPAAVQTECITNAPSGFAPPDIHGAVSNKRLVVVTNVDIGVYKKGTCAQVSFQSLKSLFSGFTIASTETLFDPQVIWDPNSKRFFVAAESSDSSNSDQYLYFAVSKDELAKTWHVYRVGLSVGNSFFCKNATTDFYDYPKAGVNKHKWFMTSNNFPAAGGAYGTIMTIGKAATLKGTTPTLRCWKNLDFNVIPPIVWDLSRKATFLSPRSGTMTRYQLKTKFGNNASTFSTPSAYTIGSWTSPPGCPQPNGEKLDSLDGRFQSASIQIGNSIWNAHAIAWDQTHPTAIRWYRLKTGATATVAKQVTFLGSHSDSCVFNPSFATSPKGASAFITLSETSSTTNAAFWVWRGKKGTSAGWGTDVVQVSSTQFTGCNASSRGSCRWGDYSAAQIDPSSANGNAMWGCNELVNGTSQFSWETRCAKIKR